GASGARTKSGLCCSQCGQSARSAGRGCQNRGLGTDRPPGAGKGACRRSKRIRGYRAQSQHGRAAEQRARRNAQGRRPISGTVGGSRPLAKADSESLVGRGHAAIEERLKASGIKWVILRPGPFMQNVLGQAASIKTDSRMVLPFAKDLPVALIDVRDTAAI